VSVPNLLEFSESHVIFVIEDRQFQ